MCAALDEERRDATELAVHRLLEAAVPSLAAPADRMDRIRRRIRRRRRRTAAGVGTVVTAAAALAGVVWGPDVHRDEPVVPASTSTAGPHTVRLLGPDRPLTVHLPKGWHALTMQDARGTPLAFVSPQPLSRPAPGHCVAGTGRLLATCSPVDRLADDGLLIVLYAEEGSQRTTGEPSLTVKNVDPVVTCADVGAQGELAGHGDGRPAPADSFAVSFTACWNSSGSGGSGGTNTAYAEAKEFLRDTFSDGAG
ncbi:hypothetical protein GCM10010129_78700 [Streptomyces fumigatiscleroticus]|nr:hypothetical protein GCM10010129_78700 [Streptomyces fumigatiscleroticus]